MICICLVSYKSYSKTSALTQGQTYYILQFDTSDIDLTLIITVYFLKTIAPGGGLRGPSIGYMF